MNTDNILQIAALILAGAVLHADNVTAGNGSVIDWRAIKSGETLLADGDAFDVAYLFVAVAAPEAVARCL